MPYDPTDPRSQLSGGSAALAVAPGIPRPATYRELAGTTPDERTSEGGHTWWTRSAAMVIAQSEVVAGDAFETATNAESFALWLDGATGAILHATGAASISEDAAAIVPPGAATVSVATTGTLIRIFAAALEPELAARCANAGDYAADDDNVAGYAAWPGPPDGHRVRVYPLAAYPPEPGRLGRILRCSTVMVNVFEQDDRPRDPTKLSPHHHDDFEQVSLQVDGDYVHHMRVAWTPDSSTWRDDEHHYTTAPAVVVIPPPLIHTSQAVGDMRHWLIDVFAPPRLDFSQRPGWVLNADEYPMPS